LAGFARQEGLDVERLARWKRRLEATSDQRGIEPLFVEVPARCVPARSARVAEIVLRSGRILRVSEGLRHLVSGATCRGAWASAIVLSLPPSVRVFMATQPIDGRKGADSLMNDSIDGAKADAGAPETLVSETDALGPEAGDTRMKLFLADSSGDILHGRVCAVSNSISVGAGIAGRRGLKSHLGRTQRCPLARAIISRADW
jgi:hypothetical protein